MNKSKSEICTESEGELPGGRGGLAQDASASHRRPVSPGHSVRAVGCRQIDIVEWLDQHSDASNLANGVVGEGE